MKPKHQAAGARLRIVLSPGIAIGPGKADLLAAIAETGSISAAGRRLKMSYRRAWLLVDVMNRCWREPIVETSPGSSHGGGARLTAFGESVLAHYRSLQQRLSGASDCPDQTALAAAMLAEPRKSQKG